MPEIIVRKAELSDAGELSRLIHALAEFEEMSDECLATPESVERMMSEENGLGGVMAFADGKAVGMALYSLYRLATFAGQRVLYIEDIFVEENMRHEGIGGMMFDMLEKIAEEHSCRKLEWKCLSWNENAKAFYDKRGGSCDPQWLTYTKYRQ